MEEINGLSAVIPCYNSSDVIEPTIRSLLGQELDARLLLEIIVVDNNCTDDTIEKVENLYNGYSGPFKLKILQEKEPGTAFARKTAVLNASGDIISLIDDDNILNNDWVQKVCDIFRDKPDVGAVGGYNEPLIRGEKPDWFDKFQVTYACGKQGEKSSYVTERTYLFGAGSSFRKKILMDIYLSQIPLFLCGKKVGAPTSGNDSELCLRTILMGWELWYEQSLRLQHLLLEKRLNWDYVIDRRIASGRAEAYLRIFRRLKRYPLRFSFESFDKVIAPYLREYTEIISSDGFKEKINSPCIESQRYWGLKSLLTTLFEIGPVRFERAVRTVVDQFKDYLENGGDDGHGGTNNNPGARPHRRPIYIRIPRRLYRRFRRRLRDVLQRIVRALND